MSYILSQLNTVDDLEPRLLYALAVGVEDKLYEPVKEKLGAEARLLTAKFQEMLHQMDDEVRAVVRGDPSVDPRLRQVFSLGQLEFAGAVLMEAYVHRAEDAVVHTLADPIFGPIFDLLLEGPKSEEDLLTTGERSEVFKLMDALFEIGGICSAMHGKVRKYSLTPLSESILRIQARYGK